MTIFIGGAWPYANGSLHLGRVASLLAGDILARYFRAKGEDVLYVSGSDCHGTPISVRADQEGVEPGVIADRYHDEFVQCFRKLGFSYDLYTRTDDPFHHRVVQELFVKLLETGWLYEKDVRQMYCGECRRFLPDRYVEGCCPHCGHTARGDQCDACSSLLDPSELLEPKCKLCGDHPETRGTEHYFLALSRFQQSLEQYARDQAAGWRDNAKELTQRYLNEGLHDRAATRDLSWGVDVPLEGWEGKKIYVWIEAVSGYLSASMKWAADNAADWRPYWSEQATSYFVHGKDNIPFHTLILPALLMGAGELHLPDRILSSEYLTLEGRKFSTSSNWAVWLPYMLEKYAPDSLRYFLIANGPEQRDTNFSWREFIYSHNGELLGAFGNFVNRNLQFIVKAFQGIVPGGRMNTEIAERLRRLYPHIGAALEAGRCKEALEEIFAFIRSGNKYFDGRQPWRQVKEAPEEGADTLFTCVQIIANLSNLLSPFLPFACDSIRSFLGLAQKPGWSYIEVPPHSALHAPAPLFERLDTGLIEEETARLKAAASR
ncbi:methionine--tRNA ligase [Paenibacillus doosanensis]|uniref:methionine--tRNA ligase n=1 Tax=Paenibacillus doosanensis TaxID=1229154 RepID=UPI0021801069|nr:methionine--tRNA ligase [Paenibacillus doosanensis]MCS7463401.1 methionine--tRNA ligase [Paenibacillus doosanensis]